MAQKLNRIIFTLREGETYIPLIALLKATDVVYSGSEAQEVVAAGMVLRNGEVELRKRAKITAGEVIVFQNYEIEVEGWEGRSMENKEDKALLDNLRAAVFDKKDPWDALVEVFDTIQPDERERLHQQYPELTEMEFKDIILSYFGVSRQDEALMLKTSVHTIDKIRTSVKKKKQESAEKSWKSL